MRSLFPGFLILFVLAHFVYHVITALLTPLLPLIRDDFTLSYTQSGLMVSAFAVSNGISTLVAGVLADRIGRRVLITISISGVALTALLVGLSPSYVTMVIFLIAMGLLNGGYHPSAIPLISAAVEPNKRGQALGLHMIGGSGSFFLSPIIAVGIAAIWGWRGPFISLAVPAFVFGIVFYVFLRRVTGEKQTEQRTTISQGETPPAPGRWHRLVAFLILTALLGAVTGSVVSFIPLYIVDHFGRSEKIAAVFLATVYSAGFWAAPLGGYLADRFGRLTVVLVTSLIAGPLFYLLTLAPYGLTLGVALVAIGMIIYIRIPVSEAFLVGQVSERRRSTLLGIFYFSGSEAGALLTPVIGNLIDRFGFNYGFTVAGVAIFVVALVCSLFLWGSRH
ncbi:MAG: MFS transporter [Chloroflexi bacterium]|nr:MFS transporter [Chloroflexota bacterium]